MSPKASRAQTTGAGVGSSQESGPDDAFSAVVELLVAQTEAMTTNNLRLEQMDLKLSAIERVLSKWDTTKEIGEKIDAAVSTQENERASLAEKKIKANAAVAKAEAEASVTKFLSLAKIAEKAQEIATSKVADGVLKILLFLMLGLSMVSRGCTIPNSDALLKEVSSKESSDVQAAPREVDHAP